MNSRHEILAGKLATLLERSEIRDLVDVKTLIDAGARGTSKPAFAMRRRRTLDSLH